MAGLRVHFVMPQELVERIDGALVEGQSRGEFVRRAVEQVLGHSPVAPVTRSEVAPPTPAPAEQPSRALPHYNEADALPPATSRAFPSSNGRMARSSLVAKRDVRPVPKAGEK